MKSMTSILIGSIVLNVILWRMMSAYRASAENAIRQWKADLDEIKRGIQHESERRTFSRWTDRTMAQRWRDN